MFCAFALAAKDCDTTYEYTFLGCASILEKVPDAVFAAHKNITNVPFSASNLAPPPSKRRNRLPMSYIAA